jgi:hypothetical protein
MSSLSTRNRLYFGKDDSANNSTGGVGFSITYLG